MAESFDLMGEVTRWNVGNPEVKTTDAPFGLGDWGPESVVWRMGCMGGVRGSYLHPSPSCSAFDSEASIWRAVAMHPHKLMLFGHPKPFASTVEECMDVTKANGCRALLIRNGDLEVVTVFYVQ